MTPLPPKSFWGFLVAPFKGISLGKAGGYLRSNFFFLLWILFVPLLMLGMRQGWELLYGLFDDTGVYPGLRAASLLFVYFLLAMAVWLLPITFFPKADNDSLNRLRPVTGENPYRALLVSSLPMALYGVVMLWVQSKRGFEGWQWALTVATVVAGVYGMYWMMEKVKMKIGTVQFWMGMNWALVFGLISIGKTARLVFWNYYFIGLCIIIQIALLGKLLKHLEAQFEANDHRTHRRYYRFVLWTVVIATIGLSLLNNLHFISPTFILLMIITFYVTLNDLVIALYVLKGGKLIQYGLSGLLILLFVFIFLYPSKIHNINYVRSPGISANARAGFDAYFKKWYETNIAPGMNMRDTGEIPIFLVAAQGGGSRAGLWTSGVLNRLETESDFRFHSHLFAITSASGGSVGAGATLSLWRYLQEHPEIDTTTRKQLCDQFAQGVFNRNYLSSQFMQLFVNEVPKRAYRFFDEDIYDRNFEHQRHEVLGFASAIRYGYEMTNATEISPFERIRASFKNGDHDSLNIGKGRPKIANYPMRPYLSYWYDSLQQPDTRLPLYFPITTHIQTGRSGYASPLQWDTRLFVDAIDIIGKAEKADTTKTDRSLALVTATNLSQLFPAINSYTYIGKTGNFMDGGLFENLGLPLLSSIYIRLDSVIAAATYIPKEVKERLKIKVLFLINDDIAPLGNAYKPLNQSWATFQAVGFSSISGASTWWQEYFCHTLLRNNAHTRLRDNPPVELVLQDPHTRDRDRVPLGRWLSKRSVDSVCARVDSLRVGGILGGLK